MARGYPDFFGNPIFNQYGGITTEAYGTFNIAAGNNEKIVDISAKGRIQGGWVYASGADLSLDGITVSIDGLLQYKRTLGGVGIVWWMGNDQPIRLQYYASDNTIVGFTFNPDWIFGTNFSIWYENNGAGAVVGTHEVIYNVVA